MLHTIKTLNKMIGIKKKITHIDKVVFRLTIYRSTFNL